MSRHTVLVLLLFMGSLIAPGLSASVAAPPSAALTRFTFTQYHMGVDARLVVYAKDKTTAERAGIAAFKRIGELDDVMSDYRPSSELMRLCGKAGGSPVRVSRDLFTVLSRAQEVSRRSKGTFDVTVGPLVALWRKARKTSVLPSQEEIKAALKLVGWQKVHLDAKHRTVRLDVVGMRLDLGGIGKGYAGDQAQRELEKFGVTRALVELGGDIVVSGPPPGTKGWTIRVPNAGKGDAAVDMHFAYRAISTSGDTEQFVVIAGVRYSHVVDPRTGMAVTSRTQATVIAKNGLTSDPLSKSVAMLGNADRKRLLRAYPGTRAFVKVLEREGERTPVLPRSPGPQYSRF